MPPPTTARSVPFATHIVRKHLHILDGEPDKKFGCKDPNVVKVRCLQSRSGSVCNLFHVSMPAGAQVRLLRQRLKPHLPPSARITAEHSFQKGRLVIQEDGDFLPPEVTVSVYDGVITHDMVLTRNQCCNVQQVLRLTLEDPAVQKMLDKFQVEAEGAEQKYRWRLSGLLQTEIYPSIARHFGLLQKEGQATLLPIHAIGLHSQNDVQMTENWVILESLMRNKDSMAMAWAQLTRLRAPDGPSGCDSDLPEEPNNCNGPYAGPLPASGRGAEGARTWEGAQLLRSAVLEGEGMLAAELRLSRLLEEESPLPEYYAQRAAVRLALGLYDAALSDALAAGDAEGADAAFVAANAGLQQFGDALHARGKGSSMDEDVRSHIRLLERQSGGYMDLEQTYWSEEVPTLLPRVAEYSGPVKLGLVGQSGSRRRCLFAAKHLEPGELLMSSRALVDMKAADGRSVAEQTPATSSIRESAAASFAVYRRAAQISRHASRILGTALSDGCFRGVLPMQELFWYGDLEGADDRKVDDAVILGVICTNAFKDLDDSLFPAASMANHSCMPNAVVVKLGNAFLLRARKSIESGEEITINYFDIMIPFSDRADRCKAWHFTCVCKRCEAEKKVPKTRLVVPIAMQKQLSGMRNFLVGTSNAREIVEKLEAAVHFLYGKYTNETMWVCASFISLYISQAETADAAEDWDKLLRLFEVVHPGSFLHCKLTLNRWRRARAEADEDALAPAAWRQCVEAHRLRYGALEGDAFMRLLEATRRSVDDRQEEFCMN